MKRAVVMLVFLAAAACGVRADSHFVDFSLPDASGELHRLSDYRGKWVVVNFWATWCGPCMVEIPELIDFHERHKDDHAVVIGINFEEIEAADLVKFIDEMGINYLVVRHSVAPIVPFEPLKGLPSTFVVDPRGEYFARLIGVDAKEIVKEITKAIEEIEEFVAQEVLRASQESAAADAAAGEADPGSESLHAQ